MPGVNHDCEGSANLVTCCQGHYQGKEVGPTDQCSWEYFEHGQQMECGSSDQVRYIQALLSLVQLLDYSDLIGRELHSDEIFSH